MLTAIGIKFSEMDFTNEIIKYFLFLLSNFILRDSSGI